MYDKFVILRSLTIESKESIICSLYDFIHFTNILVFQKNTIVLIEDLNNLFSGNHPRIAVKSLRQLQVIVSKEHNKCNTLNIYEEACNHLYIESEKPELKICLFCAKHKGKVTAYDYDKDEVLKIYFGEEKMKIISRQKLTVITKDVKSKHALLNTQNIESQKVELQVGRYHSTGNNNFICIYMIL